MGAGLRGRGSCSDEKEPGKPTGRVTGKQPCEALLRPDLAELPGTPTETAKTAFGNDGSAGLDGAKKIPMPTVEVEFDTYTVTLSATKHWFHA